jgi:hypothetical protein
MGLAGQAKSFPEREGLENCNRCRYKLSLVKHCKDHIVRTNLRITFQRDQSGKALTEKNCMRAHISFFSVKISVPLQQKNILGEQSRIFIQAYSKDI